MCGIDLSVLWLITQFKKLCFPELLHFDLFNYESIYRFFKREDIIFYLCRIRAKHAKQRNKKHLVHLLTRDERLNYHNIDFEKQSDYEKKFQNDLNILLPSRKKWKNLGENSRYKKNTKQKISTVDKNVYSLIKTIEYYEKENPTEKFILELNSFIKDIRSSIENNEYNISVPSIYPKPKTRKSESELKKNEHNICRPIALFTLKDRLILSLTNKYLTQLFDCYFDDCSMAFRAVKRNDGKKVIVNHHNAIKEILKYKSLYNETPLWVTECDIKKFYDSVNHKIIIKYFEMLIDKVKNDNPGIDITFPQKLFYKYLECYSFNTNVNPLNDENEYWTKYKIAKGKFGWVNDELKYLEYYDNIDNERIGIPQGGALSGLIANIVLDYVDKKVNKKDLFYVRFCDDMILMHPNYQKCWYRKNVYIKALKELKLVPHPFCKRKNLKKEVFKKGKNKPNYSLSPFWKEKSKGPYKWDELENGGFPWIGFVGYEIHLKGFLRVRKCSLEKEIKKQHEVINQIRNAVKNDKRVKNGKVTESAIHRLIGMSVGRVELWNYKTIENEMCWANGFQALNNNRFSVKQLKELDRLRSKLYYKLKEDFGKSDTDEEELENPKQPSRQIYGYNKPFSYYYQVAEKKEDGNS